MLWQSLGNLALDRNRPDDAVEPLRKALAACQRAGDEQNAMLAINSLGNAERQRGNREAALAWYERSLELAERLGSVQGQAMARSNRAILLSDQAQETTDPAARLRLLNQAVAEERESLALKQQLGQPAPIAISRNNLAEYLRQLAEAGGTGLPGVDEPDHRQDAGATADHGQDPHATLLHEAEQHALQALAIWERLNDPRMPWTLQILEQIAEARGDAAAAAEYRRRKAAAAPKPNSVPAAKVCRWRRSWPCCNWP